MRVRPARSLRRRAHFWVVVPCYRYGHFLEECVRSIAEQPGVSSSVLIIDDASPDDSFEVAERLAEQYPGVSAVRNEANLGHVATYNRGLARADSDYTILLSADDILGRGALARAAALMERYPQVGLVYGAPENFEARPTLTDARAHTWSVWTGPQWIRAQMRRGLGIIYSPEAVVRTSVHHQVGYYDTALPHTGDLDMWLRVAAVSGVGRVNGPYQAHRRIHGKNMMTSSYGQLYQDITERARTYEHFLDHQYGPNSATGTRLRRIVMRRLCLEAFGWASENADRAPDAELDRYQALGERLFPDYRRLGGAQEYFNARSGPGASRRDRLQGLAGQLNREIGKRFRWHSWKRFGF